MVVIVYQHLGVDRKYTRPDVRDKIYSYEPEQALLELWIRRVLVGSFREHWKQRARLMRRKWADYEWFTGKMLPFQKPWRD
jgi:hypothetical protein